MVSVHFLWEDKDGEEDRCDGQQQRQGHQAGGSGGRPVSLELDEAGPVGGDLAVDPVLVLGHAGVDSREPGLSTAASKTHHASQNPRRVAFTHHRAAGVALRVTRVVTEPANSNWGLLLKSSTGVSFLYHFML